jgi:hypothetical protein
MLPFVFVAQFFQLYNAYQLFKWGVLEVDNYGGWLNVEWQLYVVCLLFFTLFLGNFITTLIVLSKKINKHNKSS